MFLVMPLSSFLKFIQFILLCQISLFVSATSDSSVYYTSLFFHDNNDHSSSSLRRITTSTTVRGTLQQNDEQEDVRNRRRRAQMGGMERLTEPPTESVTDTPSPTFAPSSLPRESPEMEDVPKEGDTPFVLGTLSPGRTYPPLAVPQDIATTYSVVESTPASSTAQDSKTNTMEVRPPPPSEETTATTESPLPEETGSSNESVSDPPRDTPQDPYSEPSSIYVLDLLPFSLTVNGTILEEDLGMTAYLDYQMKAALGSTLMEVTVFVVSSTTTTPSAASIFSKDPSAETVQAVSRNYPNRRRGQQEASVLAGTYTIEFVGTARFHRDPSADEQEVTYTEDLIQFYQIQILRDSHALNLYWNANEFFGTIDFISLDYYGKELDNNGVYDDGTGLFGNPSFTASSSSKEQEQMLWIIIFSVAGVFVCVIVVGMLYMCMMRPPSYEWDDKHLPCPPMPVDPEQQQRQQQQDRTGGQVPPHLLRFPIPPSVLNFENDGNGEDISELGSHSLPPNYDPNHHQPAHRHQNQCHYQQPEKVTNPLATTPNDSFFSSKVDEWSYKMDVKSTTDVSNFAMGDFSPVGIPKFNFPGIGGFTKTESTSPTSESSPNSSQLSPIQPQSSAIIMESPQSTTHGGPAAAGGKNTNNEEVSQYSESQFTFQQIATRESFDNSISVISSDHNNPNKKMTNAVSIIGGLSPTPSSQGTEIINTSGLFEQVLQGEETSASDKLEWTERCLSQANSSSQNSELPSPVNSSLMKDSTTSPESDPNNTSFQSSNRSTSSSLMQSPILEGVDPKDHNRYSLPKWQKPRLNSTRSTAQQEEDNYSLPSDEMVGDFDHDLGELGRDILAARER